MKAFILSKSSITLMTDGPVWKRIVMFAIPIFWGNLFQQLYNTVDSLIVGNYLGESALAAVTSSGHLIFLMVGFFNGIAVGAGVVTARYFGSKDYSSLKKAMHTTVAFGLVCGILLTFIGTVSAPTILRWMGTPSDVLPQSISYFKIYFMGSLAFAMYNFFVGLLQSLGDSYHPLIYLIISSIVNVGLDLLFIAGFHQGVGAAALATVLSQILSALLCLRRLLKNPPELRLELSSIHFYPGHLKAIISNGFPAGLQSSIISIANIFVQTNINHFGKMAIAGCGTYAKIQGFVFLPITCFSLALTTFISQNLGAGKIERARKGAIFGIICSLSISELIGGIIYLFIPYFISAFSTSTEVIAIGSQQARTDCLFYFLLALSHCMSGIFRGCGKSKVPMYVMLICWCLIRVSYITIALQFFPSIQTIFFAYPITWALSSIIFLIYYKKSNWLSSVEPHKNSAV